VTEAGRHVRDYDFRHHSGATARDLGYHTVFRILAGETLGADVGLVERIFEYFAVADVPTLAEKAADNLRQEYREIMRQYGNVASLITEAASDGVPLALTVCDMVVSSLGLGVRLVGSLFQSDVVLCALIGGVARSKYIRAHLSKELERETNKRYELVEPALLPEAGAVLMALDRLGIAWDETSIANLPGRIGNPTYGG
ncbi:MAG: ATPase, partial [Gammaproteobacteria bacterium]